MNHPHRRQNIIKGRRANVVLLGITRQERFERRPAIEPLITRLNASQTRPSH